MSADEPPRIAPDAVPPALHYALAALWAAGRAETALARAALAFVETPDAATERAVVMALHATVEAFDALRRAHGALTTADRAALWSEGR